jgi:hypothetical protein
MDSDADQLPDGCDACPLDATDDSDADGVCDSADLCPGADDALDFDGDGVADGCDPCPADPLDDSDGDGVCDVADACPGFDDRVDGDGDGAADGCDPCPLDATGDSDADGVCDSDDLCPGGADWADLDSDGTPDFCDACPLDSLGDSDADGSCDSVDLCTGNDTFGDTDGDGVCGDLDPCPASPFDDSDGDTVCDDVDQCPNGDDQLDADADGSPDACDACPTDPAGMIDTDLDGVCDTSDLCPGFNDLLDIDADGVADGCDPCPMDNPDDLDADGICNSIDTESCDDLLDNDGDGGTDCADPDCSSDPACVAPPVVSTVVGSVVNPAGAALNNTVVSAGGLWTVTDPGGHFVLPDLLMPPGGRVLVTFERDGFATNQRWVELIEGEQVFTMAVLKAPNVLGWFLDPVAGFTITDPAVTLDVPAGALVDDSGQAIVEPVNVAITTGNPWDPLDAPVMPGDYMSARNGGTPLESVAFLDIEIVTANLGMPVRFVDGAAPVQVELPIPLELQADYAVGDPIDWWSFDEDIGSWVMEGQADVFDNAGTLWTQADVTHFSWWNVDRPVDQHGCICVDVFDAAGTPMVGAQVVASGETYSGTSSPVLTDANGRACVTIKNSINSAEQINLFVQAGTTQLAHPDNPIDTPAVQASCLRQINCPSGCDVLMTPFTVDMSGTVTGAVTLRDGSPAVGFVVSTDQGTTGTTDALGVYSLPVFLNAPFTVFTIGHTSPQLTATTAQPVVTHDIPLLNLPPQLIGLTVNGIPQSFPPDRLYVFAQVADDTVPVEFDAQAIDQDGDPVSYAWSGFCYDPNTGGPVPLTCTPPDAPITTCDPPSLGSPNPGGTQGCQYILELDDGYVPTPVQWTIGVMGAPGP